MSRRRPEPPGDRWVQRRLAGLTVRATVLLVPFTLSVAAIAALGRLIPAPDDGRLSVARYLLIFASSWLVMALTHRALHRLLPLAGLLEMSLLFPERAPSRLRLARRVASRRDLEDLRSGRAPHVDETTQEAAERILALVSALSEHDRGTRGHSERVRVLTDLIATRMGVSEHDRDRLRWAALLHDIGKLRVPVEILNKPRSPSAREWEVLRRHPHHGAHLAAPLLTWLGPWGDVIAQHHEKWNGSGYPQGLAGHQICLGARIVMVADAFDVMTAARAYKKASGRTAALRELVRCSGSHFDPEVVRALITLPQSRMLLTMGPVSWLTGLPFIGQSPAALSTTLTSQAGVAVGAAALTGTAALTPLVPATMADGAPGVRGDRSSATSQEVVPRSVRDPGQFSARPAAALPTSLPMSEPTSDAASGPTSDAASGPTSGPGDVTAARVPPQGGPPLDTSEEPSAPTTRPTTSGTSSEATTPGTSTRPARTTKSAKRTSTTTNTTKATSTRTATTKATSPKKSSTRTSPPTPSRGGSGSDDDRARNSGGSGQDADRGNSGGSRNGGNSGKSSNGAGTGGQKKSKGASTTD